MSWQFILVLVAVFIFAVYNGVFIGFFGIPRTLSNSFYELDSKKRGFGYLFTLMMFTVAMLLVPAWISITESVSEWSKYLTALPFLGAACIAFVGAAPAFRDNKMEGKVHTIAASSAAFFSLLWCAVVCYEVAWLIPVAACIVMVLAYLTKTERTKFGYWIEMVAFLATFMTMILECVKQML